MNTRLASLVLVLAAIVHVTSAQNLTGCGDMKGCYVGGCVIGECTAFVTWENTGTGETRFAMRASRPAGLAWVAVGLRPSAVTSGMVPADVYACTKDGTEVERTANIVTSTNRWDSEYRDIPAGAVVTESISFDNNVISCVFTRAVSSATHPDFYNISGDNAYFLLLAVGDKMNDDGTISGNYHVGRWVAPIPLKLQSEFEVPPVPELSGCGDTKGCFRKPSDCIGYNCMAFMTWENTDDGQTRFALEASRTEGLAWVAFGLRPSATTSGMVPADVYVCTRNGTAVERTANVVSGTGSPDSVSRTIPTGTVTTEWISFDDNVISCVFTRNASSAADVNFYDISGDNAYFPLLAVGDQMNDDGTIAGNIHKNRWPAPVPLKLQSDFVMPPEPELTGCGESKGCFRQPPTCTGEDCTAFVTWENTGDGRTRFAMRASRPEGLAWVAVGLRPSAATSGMVPADVYVCTSNGMAVERTENVFNSTTGRLNSEPRMIPSGTVTTELITFVDNVISCVFTRAASSADNPDFYDISGNNAYFLLLAIGDEINDDGTIAGNYHKERWPAPAALKLQSELEMPTSSPLPPSGIFEGCGQTKGCFSQLDGCTGDDCAAYVIWEILENGLIRFTLRAQIQSWVAVGLRPSNVQDAMSPAEVYACTKNNEVRRSQNVGTNSEARSIPDNTVSDITVTFEDNVISCMFTRQLSLAGDDTVYNVTGDNRYFVLLAVGNNINADGTIQGNYHGTAGRWATNEAQKLTEFQNTTTEVENLALQKAHGSFMVIAWVGFASIGITLARYFKPMWPSSKLLGQKVWFTIHRMCMLTCVLCFCTAFILIFVDVGGFVSPASTVAFAHAICGIIVTCLGIINPIMAIFRPHPGTPNRPIFNWAHWSVGTLAHVLALATVLMGISILDGLNYPLYITIAFVAFHLLMWALFEVQGRMMESKGQNDIPMKQTGADSTQQLANPDPEPPAASSGKLVLLSVYALGVIAIIIFLIVIIALAN